MIGLIWPVSTYFCPVQGEPRAWGDSQRQSDRRGRGGGEREGLHRFTGGLSEEEQMRLAMEESLRDRARSSDDQPTYGWRRFDWQLSFVKVTFFQPVEICNSLRRHFCTQTWVPFNIFRHHYSIFPVLLWKKCDNNIRQCCPVFNVKFQSGSGHPFLERLVIKIW